MAEVISLAQRRHRKVFKEGVDSIKLAYSEILLEAIRTGENPARTLASIQHAIPKKFIVKQFKVILTPGTARVTFNGKYADIDEVVSIVYTWS